MAGREMPACRGPRASRSMPFRIPDATPAIGGASASFRSSDVADTLRWTSRRGAGRTGWAGGAREGSGSDDDLTEESGRRGCAGAGTRRGGWSEADRRGAGAGARIRGVRGDRGPAPPGHRAAADQQPGRAGRRRLPRAEQRPDADPQLRQAGPAESRPGLSRAGADPDRRGGAAGRHDHPGHARPVPARREPGPPRADRPGPAGAGSARCWSRRTWPGTASGWT